ncbi:glycosyltransferase family 2 protein [Botrimarina colliarenosi]|nr:glycosyltransferase family 2 protein [Botrimarina colliarenosi]
MPDALTLFAALGLVGSAVPAYFYGRNRTVFGRAPNGLASGALSVLIPARNEAANIEACIAAVLAAGEGVDVEVVALDDASEDDTAAIVERLSLADSRVRFVRGRPLPVGWNGKQHACQQLADAATHETLLWIDADVRLEPHALGRLLAEQTRTGADLLSGFPRQVTVTWLERLLLPLIHFVLLGFLSLRAMRKSLEPSFAAGCGQLFLTRRDAYRQAGGHAAIRASRHDGVTLPRAYRRAGLKTDLFDATDVAHCRMYDSAAGVWNGLAKNATEGVATPALLIPVTALLLLGQVMPLPMACFAWWRDEPLTLGLSLAAIGLSIGPRIDAALRFRQPFEGALAHPIGVLLFLFIQWEALVRDRVGKPVAWRGRGAVSTP